VREDYTDQTPGVVTGAVACGVAPLPLLGVYSVIFLIHGSIKPVQPPDITSTKQGEFVAGWISLALLIVSVVAVLWMLNGKRRWPLAIVQAGVLGTCIDFALDSTKGGPFVPSLMIATSLISLVLMFAPSAWWWVGRPTPRLVEGLADVLTRRQSERTPATGVERPVAVASVIPEEIPQREPAA